MLTAEMKDGRMVTLALLPKEEVESLRLETFYCPACKSDVLIKSGIKVIPHFAHRSKVECTYSGGEGEFHQKGKLLLYQWFIDQGVNVRIEYFIAEIQQRPDIYFEIGSKKVAIEFQCAKIPLKEVIKRNEGYRKLDITPIWILGTNLYERVTTDLIKIHPFAYHMVHQYREEGPTFLYYLCPREEKISIIQHIYFLKGNIAYVQQQMYPLQQIDLRHLFAEKPLNIHRYVSVWRNEKKRFRLYRQMTYGKERKWESSLYEKRLHRSILPSYIHLPIKNQMVMRVSLWQWQSRILYDLIDDKEIHTTFTEKEAEWLIRSQMMDLSYFPLLKIEKHPAREYLELLCQVGIIREMTKGVYVKKKQISHYKNLDEALDGDYELLLGFMYNKEHIEHSL